MSAEERRPLLGSNNPSSSANESASPLASRYETSSKRWFMLTALSLLNFSTGMIWITFGPIADITAEYYNVGDAAVNWLSIVFMLATVPFGFVAIWMLDNKGLKPVIHTGAYLNFLGGALRLVSIFNSVPLHARYPILMCGQAIAAVGQPFALLAPTKMAATWFPDSQRAKANMIASMANPIGIMTANILSPIIATQADKLYWVLEAYCIPAALALFLVYMTVTESKPQNPPSPSAEEPSEPFMAGLKMVWRNLAFWILAFSFGGGVALFTALTTLLEQILCPRGYSDDFAGICGALLFAVGLVGAGVASAVVDKTKKFEETAKICFAMAAIFVIIFAFVSAQRNAEVWIALSICGLGGFGFAVYPVCLELSVESTYPVAEATSSGLLMVSGQVQSMIYVLIMQAAAKPMSSVHNSCSHLSQSQDFTISNWLFAGLGCLASVVLTVCYKCKYKRLQAERILFAENLVPASVNTASMPHRPLQQYT